MEDKNVTEKPVQKKKKLDHNKIFAITRKGSPVLRSVIN